MSWRWGWRPYVPVAERRAQAVAAMQKMRKKSVDVQPVHIEGRQIARTFWGRAWCDHLEKFSDYANRLPRGRTYIRNGLVCHLHIQPGKIVAKVSGSSLYDVNITIKPLSPAKWRGLKDLCKGQVGSLLELLQGRLSNHVMTVVTDREKGLFPHPREITLSCSCPDWAVMCKHVAAAMYGVGARLDERPEMLFQLREVNHEELVGEEAARAMVSKAVKTGRRTLDEQTVSDVFGIEMDPITSSPVPPAAEISVKMASDTILRSNKTRAIQRTHSSQSSNNGKRHRKEPLKARRKTISSARERIQRAQRKRWLKFRKVISK